MAHVEKYTRAQTGQLCQHYERKQVNGEYVKFGNENIDLSKTHLNYNLAPEHNQIEFIKNRCEELKCLNRKDVNVMCSWVVSKPKDLDAEHEEEFFRKTYDFLKDRYGKGNIVSAYVHKDEITPHMHFVFVPVVYDKKKDRDKVSAKERINKMELKTFHSDLDKYLEQSMGFKVNVLNEVTREGNKSIEELKKGTAIQKLQEIQKELEPLEKQYKSLRIEINELKSMRGSVKEGIKEHKSLLGKVKSITMPKETYEACCSALIRAEDAELQLKKVTAAYNKIKKSASYEESLQLRREIDNLESKNFDLNYTLENTKRNYNKLKKVIKENPEIMKLLEKAINKNKDKDYGIER